MADLEQEKVSGVFGGVSFGSKIEAEEVVSNVSAGNFGTIRNEALPTKYGFWQKFKAFWLQDIDWNKEIKVELTPRQQKIENDINEFLHQEITWEKIHDFLFQEVKFGKNK